MKILHVVASMDPRMGGVCQAVRTIDAGLTKLGVVNEVVSLDASDASFIKNETLVLHGLGPARGPWSYSAALVPWLTENLKRFDAVIIHGLWQYHSYAVRKALHRTREKSSLLPRLYVMPHGMLDPYFQRAKGRKLKALRNWIFWKIVEGAVINESHGLLFTCEEECLLARQTFTPYHPVRELVVGLGVEEPPPFEPRMQKAFFTKVGEASGSNFILFLSRIHEKKGVDILLHGYATLRSESFVPPRLVLAGPGLETPFGEEIKKIAASVRPAVLFPGMLDGDYKWGAFYSSEAFVLPSHQENFGIAVVEALACGKPVLISNQVNIWREIQEAGCGIIAEDTARGAKELLDKWTALSHEEKVVMGQRARKLYEQRFAVSPAANRLLTALNA